VAQKRRVKHKDLHPLALSDMENEADILDLAHQILQLRKKGYTHYEIGRDLNILVSEVEKIEEKCRNVIFRSISPKIENDRNLYVSQLDQVIRDARAVIDDTDDNAEKLAAMNVITKAVQQKGRMIGLEQSAMVNIKVEERPHPFFFGEPRFVKQIETKDGTQGDSLEINLDFDEGGQMALPAPADEKPKAEDVVELEPEPSAIPEDYARQLAQDRETLQRAQGKVIEPYTLEARYANERQDEDYAPFGTHWVVAKPSIPDDGERMPLDP
jgi:hypothetical protein